MQSSDKPKFQKLLSDVMAYYKQDVSEFVLGIWWQACHSFEFQQVQKAMTAHATDPDVGQFAPKVADIVRVLSGTKTDRAAIAWGKVHEAMQRVGQYTDVVFDDAAIHAVVMDMGGWPKICQTIESEIGYLQHKFCEAHRAYVGRGDFLFHRALIGTRSPDGDYTKRGLPIPDPVFIGDLEKAKKVYEYGLAGSKLTLTIGDYVSKLKLQSA